MTTTISLNVPALTDNTIAFANAAAWNNYWNGISGTVTFNPINVTGYTSNPYNPALTPHNIIIDDTNYIFPTIEMFNSLLAMLTTLETNYQTLRNELQVAGLIDEP